MSSSFLGWTALAVLLVAWSLGGYNRLVRLRAQVISAFGPVDQRLGQALELLARSAQACADAVAATDEDCASAQESGAGLTAVAAQLALSLQAARKQPLNAEIVAALKTAHATTHVVWLRQYVDSGVPAPATELALAQRAWEDNSQVTREAIDSYNRSVLAYNAAITQFPALLLAFVFSFRPAACL